MTAPNKLKVGLPGMVVQEDKSFTMRYLTLIVLTLAFEPNIILSIMWPFTCICSLEG